MHFKLLLRERKYETNEIRKEEKQEWTESARGT
jgi:hypothetical protein